MSRKRSIGALDSSTPKHEANNLSICESTYSRIDNNVSIILLLGVFLAHRFKPQEWRYLDGGRLALTNLLRIYRRDFHVTCWDERTIRHFLELYHYLYPGPFPEEHHIRCIMTIIREVGL